MNFLFSPASQDELVAFGADDYFESTEGSLFNYRVSFEEDDMVTLEDTIGRFVPLDISEIDDLISVLTRISNFQKWKGIFQLAINKDIVAGADLEA